MSIFMSRTTNDFSFPVEEFRLTSWVNQVFQSQEKVEEIT